MLCILSIKKGKDKHREELTGKGNWFRSSVAADVLSLTEALLCNVFQRDSLQLDLL